MTFLKPTFEWREHPRRPNWQQLWIITPCSCGGNFAKPFTDTWSGHLGIHCEKCGVHTHLDVLPEAPGKWTVKWVNTAGIRERVDDGGPWQELEVHFSSRCHECGFELHNVIDCPRCGWQNGSRSQAINREICRLLHEAIKVRIVENSRPDFSELIAVCPCCGDDIKLFHGNNEVCCHRCHTKLTVSLIPNIIETKKRFERLCLGKTDGWEIEDNDGHINIVRDCPACGKKLEVIAGAHGPSRDAWCGKCHGHFSVPTDIANEAWILCRQALAKSAAIRVAAGGSGQHIPDC